VRTCAYALLHFCRAQCCVPFILWQLTSVTVSCLHAADATHTLTNTYTYTHAHTHTYTQSKHTFCVHLCGHACFRAWPLVRMSLRTEVLSNDKVVARWSKCFVVCVHAVVSVSSISFATYPMSEETSVHSTCVFIRTEPSTRNAGCVCVCAGMLRACSNLHVAIFAIHPKSEEACMH